MGCLTAGDQIDAWLSLESQLIVAICPTCGGWTMFITTESPNARDWTRQCYVVGELIIPMRTTQGMGASCPQSDRPISERTCDQ